MNPMIKVCGGRRAEADLQVPGHLFTGAQDSSTSTCNAASLQVETVGHVADGLDTSVA